jgi:hypothetical protein
MEIMLRTTRNVKTEGPNICIFACFVTRITYKIILQAEKRVQADPGNSRSNTDVHTLTQGRASNTQIHSIVVRSDEISNYIFLLVLVGSWSRKYERPKDRSACDQGNEVLPHFVTFWMVIYALWDFWFSYLYLWVFLSSGIKRCAVRRWTHVSAEGNTYSFYVQNY